MPLPYKKISQMEPSKLQSKDGVENLLAALGIQWGRLQTEDKYEKFERALYLTVQRPDEANDSYLNRP